MIKRRSRGFVRSKDNSVMVGRRKLLRIGNSLCVALPREFLEYNNLSKGDYLVVIASGEMIKLIPANLE